MAKINGYPESVQAGIPKLPPCPDGWRQAPLSDYLHEVRRPADLKDDEKYRLVTVKRSRGGVVEREHLLGKNVLTKTQFFIEAGDFLISKRQIVHGACGIVPEELCGSIVSNEYAVIHCSDDFDIEYLKFLSESVHFQQTCFHSSIGVHIEKMIFKVDQWFNWKFNIPPLAEQRKIIELFRIWDRAIDITSRNIENALKRKKGLQQQLLTGVNRFGGPKNGEWRKVRLDKIATVKSSNVDKKTEVGETHVSLCNYTDVYHNSQISHRLDFMRASATSAEIDKFSLLQDDVIITKDSETPEDIAVPALVLEDLSGILCGYHLALIRPIKNMVSGAFLTNLFQLAHIRHYFYTRANGATRFGLAIGDIAQAEFEIPTIEEQHAIASVFLSLDEELHELQNQMKNFKQQRRALVQQLFLGKRRVMTCETVDG